MSARRAALASGIDAAHADLTLIVRDGLERAATVLRAWDLPVPPLEGKLLRPTIAYALVPPADRARLDDRFWLGALAIQMVHEASLLHDDILDEAGERRGAPTVYSEQGVGAALVKGDHYLTAAYRAAAWTRSPDFLEVFVTSVERTVAGEVLQGRSAGEHLDLETYFTAVLGKSGELLRAAAHLGSCLLGLDQPDERGQLGLELGALYQQVDDLLDYCPAATTGKEGLKDFRQRKWTWVLDLAEIDSWDIDEDEVLARLFERPATGASPAQRAMVYLEVRRSALSRKLEKLVPGDPSVPAIVEEWIEAARSGVERQIADSALSRSRPTTASGPSVEAQVVEQAARLEGPEEWQRYFRAHARTFSFASRLFPASARLKVAALYAYCRFTDDLVDEAGPREVETLERRLAVWHDLSRHAFDTGVSDVPLLDTVMGDAVRAEVDWLYPRALLEGVGMDLRPGRYADWSQLERYTFCVAGAVGGWMTHLFGIRDPDLLGRAHALGHGMQLTNILRDVGEDLSKGRVYLPMTFLERHGVSVSELDACRHSREPVPERYRDALEELIARAEARYENALPGIRALPPTVRRPVAVAAAAYRGIHQEVRRNDFDNLRRRARTSLPRKLWLGGLGLVGTASYGLEYGVAAGGTVA